MSRNILRKSSGKTFNSSINHTKVLKGKGKIESTGQNQRVYPTNGSGLSSISSMPKALDIHKATKQSHPGKADMKNKSKLMLCTVCGTFITSYSKELYINCSQQFIHMQHYRNEAASNDNFAHWECCKERYICRLQCLRFCSRRR
jgi:hypothetical protein